MAAATSNPQEHDVALSIVDHFRKLKDPRRPHGCLHLLHDIVVIAICATIAGAQDWQEVVTFAEKRLDWLKRFLKLPKGIPSHDTFERVFELINPKAFQRCFRNWVEAIRDVLTIKHVAIDGKTLRSSGTGGLKALHLVSAWATEQQLSLGQVAVDEKSNEITAIPELLELLALKGAIVTIDAMGCQTAIAEKIGIRPVNSVLDVFGRFEDFLPESSLCLDPNAMPSWSSSGGGTCNAKARAA